MKLSEAKYSSNNTYKNKNLHSSLIKAGLFNDDYSLLGKYIYDKFKESINIKDLADYELSNKSYILSKYGNRDIVKCISCECKFDSNDIVDIKRTFEKEDELEKELLLTEDATSIKKLLPFINSPSYKIVKTMIYDTDFGFVAILLLGDRNVNLEKVKTFLKTEKLELASISDVEKLTNSKLGFAGPINLDVKIYADIELQTLTNFVVGANVTDHHYINVNLKDLNIIEYSDFKVINKNDLCPKCSSELTFEKTLLIKEQNTTYYDELFASSFSNQLIDYNIILLKDEYENVALELYELLNSNNKITILDDRNLKPNVKFEDGELLNAKYTIIIGNKCGEGLIELRDKESKKLISVDELKKLVKGN